MNISKVSFGSVSLKLPNSPLGQMKDLSKVDSILEKNDLFYVPTSSQKTNDGEVWVFQGVAKDGSMRPDDSDDEFFAEELQSKGLNVVV